MKKLLPRLTALALCLGMLVTCAQALTVRDLLELLEWYYVDEIPGTAYEQDTVAGVLEALGDPYTEYYDADTYQSFMNSMKDTVLVGIGVVSQLHSRGVLVAELIKGAPAEEVGIRVDDVITAVDGVSLAGLDLDTAAGMIRGEEGSVAMVTVLRGSSTLNFSVVRQRVVVPATTTELVNGHIGFITCKTFGGETLGHFNEGINAYNDSADRWIVDLRANGGGEVDASIQSAGCFAGAGWFAYLRDSADRYFVKQNVAEAITEEPVVVLTSAATASASELFAAVIRDRKVGIIVGSRTYGKGVAQILLDGDVEPEYFGEGDALKVTAYRYFSYNRAGNDRVGIIPDILVSDENALLVAELLCGREPVLDTNSYLRIDMDRQWYIDLETATSREYRDAFIELLEALPREIRIWRGTGGEDGWELTTAAQIAERSRLYNYSATRVFTDVSDSPYEYQIDTLGTYGIVNGYENGLFVPWANITRGELCALVVKAIRYNTNVADGPFRDVDGSKPEDWFAEYVNALYAAGLVDGVEPDLFLPNNNISNQELITIMGRMANQLSINYYESHKTGPEDGVYGAEYDGYAADWAREWAWLLGGSQSTADGPVNLLWDSPENIAPLEPATREQAAVLMYNILRYAGILPA